MPPFTFISLTSSDSRQPETKNKKRLSFARDDEVIPTHSSSVKQIGKNAVVAARPAEVEIPGSHELCSPVNRVDKMMLETMLRTIAYDKWANPSLLFKGEVTKFSIGEEHSWNFTWDFISRLGHRNQSDIVIRKRGFTVAELLRRSSRKLDHSEYTNGLVQDIYKRLCPGLRLKTDTEWFVHRLENRKQCLSGAPTNSHALPRSLSV
mmetsp:Transcript_358/g.711  ORF Transcript_358/g.711 Transcript_358/m.711 type:complete len:207 (+) Transcript_358:94-714(+)